MPAEKIWNAPNLITLSRIAATPLLLLNLWWQGRFWSTVVGLGFLLVSLTDLLDGYLARRGGSETKIGKLLDPTADKILVMTALVVLIAVPRRMNEWGVIMAIVILGREIAVTGLRAMAAADGVVMPAAPIAKWKTGLQIAALTGLLLHYPIPVLGIISFQEVGMLLLVVATALTLWSGYAYFAEYLGKRGVPPASS
ncbi:MAG: CDP-diacylglycerol--glycerol-3-phosphate 3-phosphatidyltransferase [Myxococcota bacterium]